MSSDEYKFKPRFTFRDRVVCKVPLPSLTEGRVYTVEASVHHNGEEMISLIEVPTFEFLAFRFAHADADKEDTNG
jgi:hypothetical protein